MSCESTWGLVLSHILFSGLPKLQVTQAVCHDWRSWLRQDGMRLLAQETGQAHAVVEQAMHHWGDVQATATWVKCISWWRLTNKLVRMPGLVVSGSAALYVERSLAGEDPGFVPRDIDVWCECMTTMLQSLLRMRDRMSSVLWHLPIGGWVATDSCRADNASVQIFDPPRSGNCQVVRQGAATVADLLLLAETRPDVEEAFGSSVFNLETKQGIKVQLLVPGNHSDCERCKCDPYVQACASCIQLSNYEAVSQRSCDVFYDPNGNFQRSQINGYGLQWTSAGPDREFDIDATCVRLVVGRDGRLAAQRTAGARSGTLRITFKGVWAMESMDPPVMVLNRCLRERLAKYRQRGYDHVIVPAEVRYRSGLAETTPLCTPATLLRDLQQLYPRVTLSQ